MEQRPRVLHLPLALRTIGIATSNTFQNMSPTAKGCARMSSPMTNLTLNLSELSTGREITPRRKLSLSCSSTPDTASKSTPERSISTESGCFVESPSPIDSPTLDMSLNDFGNGRKKEVKAAASVISRRKNVAFRRFNSLPLPMMKQRPETLDHNIQHQSTPHTMEARTMEVHNDQLYLSINDNDENCDPQLSDMNSRGSSSCYGMLSSGSMTSGCSGQEKKASFYLEESCSQDSGLEMDRDARYSNDGFTFAAPKGLPLRLQVKMISEDTCSPFKYSPVKNSSPSNSGQGGSLDFSGEFVNKTQDDTESPLKMCRLTSVDEGFGGDDGFLDVMDAEVAALTSRDSEPGRPSTMSSLFNAPVLNKHSLSSSSKDEEEDDTPVTRRVSCRRNISRSMSMDVRPQRMSLKRDQPESSDSSPAHLSFKRNSNQDESTPIQVLKRRRPSSVLESPTMAKSRPPTLHRCHSESEAMIKSALARQANEPDLVGDCTKRYCLPTLKGKHQDLKSLSRETMSQVLEGYYDDQIEQAIIVDCRYPYEFDGGHIRGAKNLYTAQSMMEEFLQNPIKPKDPSKRVVLIFHCEFSSERGPRLSRFLRRQDRTMNKERYPYLHYPELYLLDGGYKAYFETEKMYCEPMTYKPMLHKDHIEDLRHFRIKSKSWAGEQRTTKSNFRPLKF